MEKKDIKFQIKGMRQDIDISQADPNYAKEIVNMRITPLKEGTMLSLVNEKGNSTIPLSQSLAGTTYVGHCVVNQYLVLFVTITSGQTTYDKIYRIDFSELNSNNQYVVTELFTTHGYNRLGFSENNILETLADYESETIIKVYWTDGQTQPKVINILKEYPRDNDNCCNPNDLNFAQSLKLSESIIINKKDDAGGLFSSGVIQYCFTYFTNFGQETNIVCISPIQYIANGNRGASPSETVGVCFDITLNGLDSDFEYIRLYSIQRTSLNSSPIVKRVADLAVPSAVGATIHYFDNNTAGEEIDPNILYYVGGEEIVAKTIEAKDSVLFLGNISNIRKSPEIQLNNETVTLVNKSNISPFYNGSINFSESYVKVINNGAGNNFSVSGTSYSYVSQLNSGSQNITIFKTREHYRLGLQFQHKSGIWSDVYWINDVQINQIPVSQTNQTKFYLPYYTFTDNDRNVLDSLLSLGYIKVRPVIVYPSYSDREILCQGMVCPTVFNLAERYNNVGPYSRASWFARPFGPDCSSNGALAPESSYEDGAWIEFRHNFPLRDSSTFGGEIQSMDGNVSNSLHQQTNYYFNTSTGRAVEDYTDYYFVDHSVVTVHPPETVFDNNFLISDSNNYRFRIVGAIPITSTVSDINILASSPYCGTTTEVTASMSNSSSTVIQNRVETVKLGFVNKKFSFSGINGWKYAPRYQYWFDEKRRWALQVSGTDNDAWEYITAGVMVYPWHKTGSFLTTFPKIALSDTAQTKMDGDYDASVLQEKKYSHFKYSPNSFYFDSSYINGVWEKNVFPIMQFNSEEDTYINIKTANYQTSKYAGNMDGVITPGVDNSGKYKLYITGNKNRAVKTEKGRETIIMYDYDLEYSSYSSMLASTSCTAFTYSNRVSPLGVGSDESLIPDGASFDSSDPVRIKYKSTPHLVVSFQAASSNNNNDPKIPTLPTFISYSYGTEGSYVESSQIKNSGNEPAYPANWSAVNYESNWGYLLLGEVFKTYDSETAFGGKSEEAFLANNWYVGGSSVSIPTDENSFTLVWDRGDTYYQRYDCLKTYPFTLEDENSIVEVVSYMCETRLNIDGRYDKNRGRASLVAHPTNFNLLNPAYSQTDNFFTYHGIDPNLNKVNNFPNLITWTLAKSAVATIDNWTTINLAATLLLDGDRGEIKRIEKFKNDLFSFQEKGISKISFNERTVLSVEDGAPIELANSNKVNGKVYFTELEGLTNKDSISVTPEGIYFIDGKSKTLCFFNGQKCVSLSDIKGMKTFFVDKEDTFKIFYDNKEKDVYFVNDETCICFSEKLGEFVGIFNYENTPMMCNIKDKFISYFNSNLWEFYEGEYNSLYGIVRPFSATFVANDALQGDKLFTNLNWMGDCFLDDVFVTTKTFDRLKVWDEYQVGEISLVNTMGRPSNLKKKFRIWRANIPRANWNGRDRIRNPWCYIQLRMDNPSRYKSILHNIAVDYYI